MVDLPKGNSQPDIIIQTTTTTTSEAYKDKTYDEPNGDLHVSDATEE